MQLNCHDYLSVFKFPGAHPAGVVHLGAPTHQGHHHLTAAQQRRVSAQEAEDVFVEEEGAS